ncbi:unnamed protein product [Staurois parvus]|uniref:Uncharacterized protein n=1 Tax=Staurois parvus TaxID=386267 RepID=A0ABN9F1Q1_9NEOB|nr:unnamed protein product [Staurois parvus]
MQMSAVDLESAPHHFTHLASHGAKTSVEPQCGGGRQQQWEAIQHPMTKMETTSSVRRPEKCTWAECVAIETAAMGGRTGTMTNTSGPGSSMRRPVLQGPMADTGLAAACGSR